MTFQLEYSALTERDLDAVTALEASLQAFPWSRGNFADSLAAGHSALVCRAGADIIGFSVVMAALDEAHLLVIGIDRYHQGRGHGLFLVFQGHREVHRVGHHHVGLGHRLHHAAAGRFPLQ